MVGRDVLGAPRPLDAHGTPTGRHVYTGRRGRRPLPCLTHVHAPRPVHTPRPIHTHGRARRPRRAAPTGRPWNAHGNATCTRAAEDVGPYHARPPVHTPRPVYTHGRARRPRRAAPIGRTRERPRERHVYAGRRGRRPLPCLTHVHAPRPVHTHGRARRPRRAAPTGRPRDAHGNATCMRAAGDVGPYHASPMSTPHVRSTPMVGRDVLGAPRTRDAHGTHTGTPHVHGPPGRRPLPCLTHVHAPRPIHTHGRARRPRRAAPTGRPRDAHGDAHGNAHGNATCTRAAEDVGPYHASRPVHTPRPVGTTW